MTPSGPPARPDPTRRPATPSAAPPAGRQRVRPAVQRILDSMTGTPAFVLTDAWTSDRQHLGYALVLADLRRPGQAGQQRPVHLPQTARDPVLFARLGQDRQRHRRPVTRRGRPRPLRPGSLGPDRELSTRSGEFRVRWAAHNVRIHTTGVKLIHHPVVGDLRAPVRILPIPPIRLRACSPTPPSPGRPHRTH